MKDYQKILVVVDPTTENQVALARAVALASKCNAQVTVFLSIFDFSYEMTSILSNQEREAMRQGVIFLDVLVLIGDNTIDEHAGVPLVPATCAFPHTPGEHPHKD